MKNRAEYLAFLERRIPELQGMGKQGPSEQDPVRIARNLAASKYPGVKARRQADREWASR